MECRNIEELLSPYLDGNLTGREIALVEEHLRTCPRCPQELEKLKRTIHLISSLKEVEPPENFLGEIHRKLKAKSRLRSFLDRAFFPLPVKLPLEALAAVLIAVIVISLNRPYPSGPASREIAKRLPEGDVLGREENRRGMEVEEAKSSAEKYEEKIDREKRALGEKPELLAQKRAKETIPERKENVLGLSKLDAPGKAEILKAKVAQCKKKKDFSYAKRGEIDADKKRTRIVTESVPSVTAVAGEMKETLAEEEVVTANSSLRQRALSANYRVQVTMENIPLGLIKAQKVIYLNKGKIISPSDEDMVAQVASREIKHSRILFEMPSRNYSQVLTQLKEVGEITLIIPPEKAEKYELRLKKSEGRPALIHIQLELTQTESK